MDPSKLPKIEVDLKTYKMLVCIVLPIAIACIIAGIIYLIIRISNVRKYRQEQARQYRIRCEASTSLGIRLPENVRVTTNSVFHTIGYFELGYPSWGVSKSDGTRDLRRKNNSIIYKPTVISINWWILSCDTPLDGYRLVLDLRRAGNNISLCTEELQKRDRSISTKEVQSCSLELADIFSRYQNAPTDFESFCANLYRSLGWQAQTTPAVRDGGYDLSMRRPDGHRFIAECKCYAPQNHVGRPVIQKLLGANAVELADGLMVITTSSFTPDARSFASETNVELVDGKKLVRLCRQAWGNRRNDRKETDTQNFEPATQLTSSEILAHYPADMRVEFV